MEIFADLPTIPLEECKVVIVGEAWGRDEANHLPHPIPFVGQAGRLLTKTLTESELLRERCYVTNTFNARPPENNVMFFFAKEGEICKDITPYNGQYLKKEWEPQIERLRFEIFNINPKVIIGVGATPLWVLLGRTGISSLRGKTFPADGPINLPNLFVLPTFHPSYCLRRRDLIPTLRADLSLAKELAYP